MPGLVPNRSVSGLRSNGIAPQRRASAPSGYPVISAVRSLPPGVVTRIVLPASQISPMRPWIRHISTTSASPHDPPPSIRISWLISSQSQIGVLPVAPPSERILRRPGVPLFSAVVVIAITTSASFAAPIAIGEGSAQWCARFGYKARHASAPFACSDPIIACQISGSIWSSVRMANLSPAFTLRNGYSKDFIIEISRVGGVP